MEKKNVETKKSIDNNFNFDDDAPTRKIPRIKKNTTKSNLTTFFSISRTSSFSRVFEKRKDVDAILKKDDDPPFNQKKIDRDASQDMTFNSVESEYDVINKLAEGGQGYISSALDRSLGRVVALKSLHHSLFNDIPARNNFVAEAKITAQLDHPGIVPIYSLNNDRHNGLHLAMKLINGKTLNDYLEQVKKKYTQLGIDDFDEDKSIRNRIDIFLRVCDGVAYAHSRNVMHCDLKPENIMLGEYNETYIMDWGISRLIHEPDYDPAKWTKPDKLSGTPRYLSPEAIAGEHTDERADIYALGLILFECIFLKPAFSGEDTKLILAKIRLNKIESLTHEFKFRISRDLKAIIRKALAAEPAKRYQSVDGLSEDLRHYLNHEEVSANPDGLLGKVVRFSYHHIRTMLIITLLGVLIGIVGSIYSLYRQNMLAKLNLRRDVAKSMAYSKSIDAANLIAFQMNSVKNVVLNFSKELSFVLNHSDLEEMEQQENYFDSFALQDGMLKVADMQYSPAYDQLINLNKISYSSQDKIPERQLFSYLKKIQYFIPSMLQTILESNGEFGEQGVDLSKVVDEFLIKGAPVLWIYAGFENGLHISFPGYCDKPRDYEPRSRYWYKNVAESPNLRLVWSNPYIDAASNKLTITCSAPILKRDGNLLGVAAADMTLTHISKMMKEHGNTENFVIDKYLLNYDGEILLDSRTNYAKEQDANEFELESRMFSDRYYFKEMRKRKNGVMEATLKGRDVVFCYSYIKALDWMYVEKIDFEQLMEVSLEAVAESEKKALPTPL